MTSEANVQSESEWIPEGIAFPIKLSGSVSPVLKGQQAQKIQLIQLWFTRPSIAFDHLCFPSGGCFQLLFPCVSELHYFEKRIFVIKVTFSLQDIFSLFRGSGISSEKIIL